MRLMVILKANKDWESGKLPEEQVLGEIARFEDQLVRAGVMVVGEGLEASSKGARVRFEGSERRVIEGPFPEPNELIAGFWIWELKSRDEAIQWLEGRGFLSDKAYAESKARSLVARGTSRAHILANLASKGVGGDDARAALEQVALEYEEPELEAAQRYARRRRIGPYRLDAEARAAARNKDLATMARAGFASRIARQVIDAEDAA